MLLVFSIPLEIMLSPFLMQYESRFIRDWQNNTKFDESFLGLFIYRLVLYMGHENFAVIVQLCFFMGSDSLISFKTTMCYCVGVYLIVMLQLMYQEPRPYWVNGEIDVY